MPHQDASRFEELRPVNCNLVELNLNSNGMIIANIRRLGVERVPAVFLLAWVFLFIIDSRFGGIVPAASVIRLVVPLGFSVLLFLDYTSHRCLAWNRQGYFVLFLACSLLSCALSVAPDLALSKLWMYCAVMLFGVWSTSLSSAFMPTRPGFNVLVFLISFLLVASVIAMPIGGIFRNPNAVGGFSVCILPFLAYQLKYGATAKKKYEAQLLVGVAMVLAVASFSRTALAAICVFFIFVYALSRSNSLWSVVAGGVVAVGVLISALYLQTGVEEIVYKDGNELLDEARTNMFHETYAAFLERPFLGYGFGLSWRLTAENVELVYRFGRLSWYVGEFGNTTLALIGGGGILSALAFYAICGSVLFHILRGLKLATGELRHYLVCMAAGVASLLVHSQGEAWLMSPFNWITPLFWLYCGCGCLAANYAILAAQRGFDQ